MKKIRVLFILSLFFSQHTAQAQKRDTLVYYLKDNGRVVADKNQANYVLFMMPAERSSGKVLYPVYEYYANGNLKLISNSKRKTLETLKFEGSCITYYPSGKKKAIVNFKNGVEVGELTQYYPNGKLYAVEKRVGEDGVLLITCRDSAGSVLADNGKGDWLKFNDDRDKLLSKGKVLDSLAEGQWDGAIDDTGRFVCSYEKGKLTSGIGYDKAGRAHPFTEIKTEPLFRGNKYAFRSYVQQNITYPLQVLNGHLSFTIVIRFTVEKDGTVTGVYAPAMYDTENSILARDYKLMCDDAIAVIKKSPLWSPGTLYGMPARTKMTFPVEFNANHSIFH